MLLAQYLRSVLEYHTVSVSSSSTVDALPDCCSSSAFDANRFQGSRCIELGAGATGLPGIVAAQLGCFSQVGVPLHTWLHTAEHVPEVDPSILYVMPQVVITDVDECLEALHENVSANLPSHCTLVASCLSQGQMAAAAVPPPASSSPAVATIPSNSDRTGPAHSSDRDHSTHDTANTQEPNAAVGSQGISSSNDAVEQQDTRSQSARCHTEVLVAELDWGRDASSVAPPFDVVLIADVVGNKTLTCKVLMCYKRGYTVRLAFVLLPQSCTRFSAWPILEAPCSVLLCQQAFWLCLCTHTRCQVPYAFEVLLAAFGYATDYGAFSQLCLIRLTLPNKYMA